jgi:hypothetical protein
MAPTPSTYDSRRRFDYRKSVSFRLRCVARNYEFRWRRYGLRYEVIGVMLSISLLIRSSLSDRTSIASGLPRSRQTPVGLGRIGVFGS